MRISRVIFSAAVLTFLSGLVTAVTAMPAAAAAVAVNYVALGDSYSSGLGAGSYISSSGSCDRSTNAYSQLWANTHAPPASRIISTATSTGVSALGT